MMTQEEILSTLYALHKATDLVDKISPIISLLRIAKEHLYVEVNVDYGFVIFGFYNGYLDELAEYLANNFAK